MFTYTSTPKPNAIVFSYRFWLGQNVARGINVALATFIPKVTFCPSKEDMLDTLTTF